MDILRLSYVVFMWTILVFVLTMEVGKTLLLFNFNFILTLKT